MDELAARDLGAEMSLVVRHRLAQYQEDFTRHGAEFREVASFNPFDGASGTRVATTSTTSGASLLVSGLSSRSQDARVHKDEFVRSKARTTMLEAVPLGEVGFAQDDAV